jgi:hypothetical protein
MCPALLVFVRAKNPFSESLCASTCYATRSRATAGLSVIRSTPQFGAYSRFGAGQVPSRRGPRTDALVLAQAYDYVEGDEPRRSTAEALADIFDNAPSAASVRNGGRPCGVDEGADTDRAIPVRDQSRADCEATTKESTWDGYDAPRSDPHITMKKRGGEEWIYPEHGPTCSPEICEARGQLERDERWKKEQEASQEARRKRQEEREKRARKNVQRAADKAGGNDASDAQGVMLIAAERTHLTLTE